MAIKIKTSERKKVFRMDSCGKASSSADSRSSVASRYSRSSVEIQRALRGWSAMYQFQINSHRKGSAPSETIMARQPQRPSIQPEMGEEITTAAGRQSIQ